MMDIYLSSVSNRHERGNEVLNYYRHDFMPLTLIAGIYGMNFRYMPELESPWGYPMVYVVMLGVSAVMLMYFRKRKWL
jgi:magnesium transporter